MLTVGSGQVVTGADIKTGPPEPWFSISGRVVDAVSGTPVPNISCGVEIYGTETTESMKGSISGLNFSNSRGEFNVDGLTPGRYRISAPSNLVVAGSPAPEQFGSSDDIEIVDRDLNGIVVKVSKSAAISGVIRIEGTTDAAALEKLRRLRLNAFSIPEPGKMISAQPLVINSDNTFSVRGLKPGRLSISLNPGGVGEDVPFQVSRIETAGVVATEDIELKSGDELSDVTVVMTYANSRIHGTVKLSNDQSIGKVSGNVFLYLDAKVIAYGMIDARGEFLIQDVPAGNFRLVADIQVPGSKPLRSEQFVTVTAGKTAEVTLTAFSQN